MPGRRNGHDSAGGDMLLQAIVEYGVQTGQAGGGLAGGWGRRLTASPALGWSVVAAAALLGLWLLLGRSSARGFGLTRLVGLVLVAGAAVLCTEQLGLTHFGFASR